MEFIAAILVRDNAIKDRSLFVSIYKNYLIRNKSVDIKFVMTYNMYEIKSHMT